MFVATEGLSRRNARRQQWLAQVLSLRPSIWSRSSRHECSDYASIAGEPLRPAPCCAPGARLASPDNSRLADRTCNAGLAAVGRSSPVSRKGPSIMALVRSDARTASRPIPKTTPRPETPKRKRRPGRPSSYLPEYCDVIIGAGKEGWSLTATAAKIGVHRATLLDWGAPHPEFGEALKFHRAHRAHWWEERLRDVAKRGGAPGQVTACIFGLKNAVPEEWRDIQHQHLEHTGKDSETRRSENSQRRAAPAPRGGQTPPLGSSDYHTQPSLGEHSRGEPGRRGERANGAREREQWPHTTH